MAWLRELRRRNAALFFFGALHFGLGLLFAGAAALDSRIVLGANPWVKPLKFAISIGIYLWTLGWLMEPLRARRRRAVKLIGGGAIVAMVGEIGSIAGQSFRGTSSHFNHSSPLNDAVFALMGLLILMNTALAAWLLYLFLSVETGLERDYLAGIRLGLLLFLFASGVGGIMVANDAHSIGGLDGGPGLPFFNFSTTHGDLRPAHGLGLHALQALPLFAFALARMGLGDERRRVQWVGAFAVVYFAAFVLALGWALSGRPFVPFALGS